MFRIMPEDLIRGLEMAKKVNGSEKENNSTS